MISGETMNFVAMGAVLGFAAGISPGPLLTLVITETIKHNKTEGIKVALSPLITDLPIIIMSYFLLSRISYFNILMGLISLLGSIFLVYLGYECFRTKGLGIDIRSSGPGSITKGIIANILNPHPYLFWITVGTPLALKAFHTSTWTAILYFAAFYSFLTGSKTAVALLTERSKTFLTNRIYIWTMRVLGSVLFMFAILFLIDFIRKIKS